LICEAIAPHSPGTLWQLKLLLALTESITVTGRQLEVHLNVLVTEDQRLSFCREEDIFIIGVVNESKCERVTLRGVSSHHGVTNHVQPHIDIGFWAIHKLRGNGESVAVIVSECQP
jgi:hypothetical protein